MISKVFFIIYNLLECGMFRNSLGIQMPECSPRLCGLKEAFLGQKDPSIFLGMTRLARSKFLCPHPNAHAICHGLQINELQNTYDKGIVRGREHILIFLLFFQKDFSMFYVVKFQFFINI